MGNIVPPYPSLVGGTAATIEYAAGVLGVPDIIVCGHTDPVVDEGVHAPGTAAPAFLDQSMVEPCATCSSRRNQPLAGTRRAGISDCTGGANVVEQLKNLRTHPAVEAASNRAISGCTVGSIISERAW